MPGGLPSGDPILSFAASAAASAAESPTTTATARSSQGIGPLSALSLHTKPTTNIEPSAASASNALPSDSWR